MGLNRGGRPKGAKNKRSADLHAKCEKVGLDVFERMLEICLAKQGTNEEWSKLRELAVYLYARPKEVELSADQVRGYLEAVANDSTRSA